MCRKKIRAHLNSFSNICNATQGFARLRKNKVERALTNTHAHTHSCTHTQSHTQSHTIIGHCLSLQDSLRFTRDLFWAFTRFPSCLSARSLDGINTFILNINVRTQTGIYIYIYICCWFTLSVVFKTGSLLRGSRAACLAPVWPLGWARTECAGEPCDTAGCVWVSVVGHSQCRPGSAAGAAGAAGAAAPAPATRSATLACSALDLIFFFFSPVGLEQKFCWGKLL